MNSFEKFHATQDLINLLNLACIFLRICNEINYYLLIKDNIVNTSIIVIVRREDKVGNRISLMKPFSLKFLVILINSMAMSTNPIC